MSIVKSKNPKRKGYTFDNEDRKQAKQMYKDGLSMHSIAIYFGCGLASVRGWLGKRNIYSSLEKRKEYVRRWRLKNKMVLTQIRLK